MTYKLGGVDLAMREVTRAVAACPHHAVASKVAGVPPLTYTITRLPRRAPWPGTTQAYRVRVTDGRRVEQSVGIFMWKGTVFCGVYGPVSSGGGLSPTVLALADAAAGKLAAVS